MTILEELRVIDPALAYFPGYVSKRTKLQIHEAGRRLGIVLHRQRERFIADLLSEAIEAAEALGL